MNPFISTAWLWVIRGWGGGGDFSLVKKKIPGSPWSEVPFTNLNMRDRASANYVLK
jgi:hypothetical protein